MNESGENRLQNCEANLRRREGKEGRKEGPDRSSVDKRYGEQFAHRLFLAICPYSIVVLSGLRPVRKWAGRYWTINVMFLTSSESAHTDPNSRIWLSVRHDSHG